jgi:hypothetical protein
MQTILMFGGDRFYPRGGSEDLLGVLPIVSEDVIFGTMREIIKTRYGDARGSYWCNVAGDSGMTTSRLPTVTRERRW